MLVLGLGGIFIAAPGPVSQAESIGTRVVAPLEFGLARAASGVSQFIGTIQHAGDLAGQNQVYRERVDRLEAEIVQMRELEIENRDLRELLGLRGRAPAGSLLPVSVIARDPVGIVHAVIVDRGLDDGLALNSPVIAWKGVVGRVVEVHPTSAKVLLATDVNSAVSVRIQDSSSRATGVARGVGDGRMLLQYVPRSDELHTGDLAITSGIGGVFPSGLVVGRVVQVRQRDFEVFQEALLEPAVDMRNLERLYVLLAVQEPSPPAQVASGHN